MSRWMVKGAGPACVVQEQKEAALQQLNALSFNNPDQEFTLFQAIEVRTAQSVQFRNPLYGDDFPRWFLTNSNGDGSQECIVKVANRREEDVLLTHRHPSRLHRIRAKDMEFHQYYNLPMLVFIFPAGYGQQFDERVAARRAMCF